MLKKRTKWRTEPPACPIPASMGPPFAGSGWVVSGLLADRFRSQFGTNTILTYCVELLVLYTAISRKVDRQNVHATTPKGNMGYDQYTVPNDCSCRTYFCCFSLALANICSWPLVPFFQISSENRADKTTHNTFRDCQVHFFRQPFSKQLYTRDDYLNTVFDDS